MTIKEFEHKYRGRILPHVLMEVDNNIHVSFRFLNDIPLNAKRNTFYPIDKMIFKLTEIVDVISQELKGDPMRKVKNSWEYHTHKDLIKVQNYLMFTKKLKSI